MQNPLAYVSAKLKELIRRSKYTLGADVINFVLAHTSFLGGSDQPPPVINFAGGGDFVKIGDVIVQRLVDHAQLKDGQAVLDVGCGIGETLRRWRVVSPIRNSAASTSSPMALRGAASISIVEKTLFSSTRISTTAAITHAEA
jgi:hypothetical protein